MRKFSILVFPFIQLLFHQLAAQDNIQFTLVQGTNGKPLGKITAITQDPLGYMWFCGQAEKCLYRFDGFRTVSFKQDIMDSNSLGLSILETVYADDEGIIWVGGDGLDEYNPATGIFKHFKHNENDTGSLGGYSVSVIIKDTQGRLWLGCENGLDRLDEKTGKFIHYRREPGNPLSLSSNIVRAIYEDRKGVIWVGTGLPFFPPNLIDEDGGLNRMNNDGTFTRYLHDPQNPYSIVNNKVRAIFEDSRGVFWVGTSGDGLHTLDRENGSFIRHRYNPSKPEVLSRPPVKPKAYDHITFIKEDSAGSIWIGTFAAGLTRYNPLTKEKTHYQSGNGFPDTTCWNACVSRDGVMWVSTETSNLLFRSDPQSKNISSIYTGSVVTSILEDQDGSLWVSTYENDLLQYDYQKKLIHQFKYKAANQRLWGINALFQDHEDTIWLAADKGIVIFDKRAQQFSLFPLQIESKYSEDFRIESILRDHQGSKWIATASQGLIRYTPSNNSFKQYQHNAKDPGTISSNTINCMLESREGDLWIGNPIGINRLNRQTDQFNEYPLGFYSICMYEDKGGTIWAGTLKGLYRFNKDTDGLTPFFDSQSELRNERCYGIVEDALNNLWIKTQSAIVKISPDRLETSVYGSQFGIAYNSLPPLSISTTKKGEILVGHDYGFYAFFPEELTVNTPWNITITDFFINNQPVLRGHENPSQIPIEAMSNVVLKYNENNFAFNFSSTDYRTPGAMKYFTMLENYDRTWREALYEKGSIYYNIPPGKYIYHVRAINRDGAKEEKVISILVKPPWWKTWWAFSVYGLLAMATIFEIYRFQKQRILRRERQKTQAKELEQAKEIEKAYHELKITQDQLIQSEKMASLGELASGIAHEIKNPLNFINNFSEINMELLAEIEDEQSSKGNEEIHLELQTIKNLKKNSEKINQHGKRVDSIVKGMLQHSRLGNLVKEPVHLNSLCEETIKLAYHAIQAGFRARENSPSAERAGLSAVQAGPFADRAGLSAGQTGFSASFETHYDPDISTISCIPADISRVLLNLINNALYSVHERNNQELQKSLIDPAESDSKYKPGLILTTKKGDHKVSITLSDNGMGIPAKVINKVFQPFFTTKPTGEGTGLGLSLAYDIITKGHQGEIKVKSEAGLGTEFEVILPI